MIQRILVTGSSGLIGAALSTRLAATGAEVLELDLRAEGDARGDVRDGARVREASLKADGIVHLAAVSRVVWGERAPDLCWSTNVGGLRNVLDSAAKSERAPWVVFASSREVYGEALSLPVKEDAPLQPVNVYGRSKAEGEMLVAEARRAGLRACTIRLSNVFGSTADHPDRVVPAFARAAAFGTALLVEGLEHTFDFTHVDDVTRGIVALTALLATGETPPPPIHFVSGRATTLAQLANLAASLGQAGSRIEQAAPRNFDVARFVGDPSRANELLGWGPEVDLEDGLSRLIQAFRAAPRASEAQGGMR